MTEKMPSNWASARLEEICWINPRLDKNEFDPKCEVSFVPMPAVGAETGKIDVSSKRRFSDVQKGYTAFKQGDVLFAKITPCMENGKMAVVPPLHGGLGFGSTEFHVVRPEDGVLAKYLYFFLSSKRFRLDAEHHMTGAVGQRRVPTTYLAQSEIPIAPTPEQSRIVAKIEELFSEMDEGIENLKQAKAQLAVYRQALLKHAFEGKLTANWRAANAEKTEASGHLLVRIRAERRNHWEAAQLENFKLAGRQPPNSWRGKYKEPTSPKIEELPRLPGDWLWANADQICVQITDGEHIQPRYTSVGYPMLSAKNVRDGFVDFNDINFIAQEDFAACLKRCAPKKDDVLIVSVGATTGRAAIVGDCKPFSIVRSVLLLRPLFSPRFLLRWIQSPWCQKYISRASGSTAQAHLYISDTKSIPCPLPPLEEQDLIVEAIESQLSEITNLETEIYTNLQKAEALRQAILKKAFEGKLVPQDPSDEPASVLLDRIRAERASAAAATAKVKKKKLSKA